MSKKPAKKPAPKGKAKYAIVMHFIPTNSAPPSRFWGKPDVPLCSNCGPRYTPDGEHLLWSGSTDVAQVTCESCKRLWHVRNRLCRRCGNMITEVAVEKYNALCTKCFHAPGAGRKVGMFDVQEDGKTVVGYGAAAGREAEAEAELAKAALAKQQKEQYIQQRAAVEAAQPEESKMAKTEKTEKSDKKSEAALAKKAEKVAKDVAESKKRDAELDNKKIKLLVKENPKREGSKAFEVFKLYKDGLTVGEFKEKAAKLGGGVANIRWDEDHGFIELK